MNRDLDFSNKLENIRADIESDMYLCHLEDKNGSLWSIVELTINLKETILKIENDETKEIRSLIRSNPIHSDENKDDIRDYKVVL